ncbi:MAG: phage tail sheath C-terminal domain-containing protein [Caulobacter sp.]|nr:phage tail sheath C-terminal domain-containing protein [Caulobacter sp.]
MATYLHPGVYVQELPGPQLITAAATSNTAFVGITETGPYNQAVLITSWNQYVAIFGGMMWGAQLPFAVYSFFVQGGAVCYVVRAGPNPPNAESPAGYLDGALQINAACPGSWGDSLAVTVTNYPVPTDPNDTSVKPVFAINVLYKMPDAGTDPSFYDQLVAFYASANKLAVQTINGESYYQVESFPGYSAADMQKATATSLSNIESKINATSIFIRVAVTTTGATRPENQLQPVALSGGTGDPTSTPLQLTTALAALDIINDISLLVAPESVSIPDLGLQREVVQQSVTYCENRPHLDLFYIADPPFGLSVQDIEAFKTGAASPDGSVPEGSALHSSYGALYYPWITFLNPSSNMNVPIPPSGAMAGTYAATDTAIGPWQVAAGITYGVLNIATGVTQILTDSDQDTLNPNGINAIRPFVNYGICAYGGRTMSTDPSLIYISVRRLLIEIEVSLYSGLQWVVFEPNTQKLWGTVTRDVSDFLTTMWQAGALFGASAAQAFAVQCDAGNNPPDLQAQGQLYVDIKVCPVFPAEFVIIRIQQATLGSS